MPTSTVEDYLKCILQAQQQQSGELVGMGQIATALNVAPGTVTAMMKTLADSGLISYEPYSGVRLTAAGEKLAAHVVRRHRLVELFLVRIMGFDWSEVHAEAERLEHAVSDRLIARMDEMLGHPSADPHGDPIPTAEGELERGEAPTLLVCPLDRLMTVVRVGDQTKEFLRLAEKGGLMPGSEVRVESRDEAADQVQLRVGGKTKLSLGFRAASKFQVEPMAARRRKRSR